MATSQDFVNWVCGPELDWRFLKYVLLAENQSFLRFASGTTHQTIYYPEVKAFHVCIPLPDVQRRIADVLAAFDDKIENNRAFAALLEASAEALYRHRFVEFAEATELVESRIGLIPEGWAVRSLGEIARRLTDNINPSSSPDQTYEHFSIPAFDQGGLPAIDSGRKILSAKTALDGGAILVSKLNPTIRRVWDARAKGSGPAICSTEFVALSERDGIPRSFIHAIVRFDEAFWDHLRAHTTGTTGSRQRVSPADVLCAEVVVPPTNVLSEFDAVAGPLFDHIEALTDENRWLIEARDMLLPGLVSGRITVDAGGVTVV
jgi:type I restriction enzyme S subunit